MKTSSLTFIFFLFLLNSCDFSKRIDTTAAVKEMKERQVKRVLPQDIVLEIEKLGQAAQKDWELSKETPEKLAKNYELKLWSGTANSLINQVKDPKIKATLSALDYSLAKQQPVEASIQKNTSGDSLFYFFTTKNKEVVIFGFSKSQVIMGMSKK